MLQSFSSILKFQKSALDLMHSIEYLRLVLDMLQSALKVRSLIQKKSLNLLLQEGPGANSSLLDVVPYA